MAHLIDKDALVAEIENIRKHYIERDDFDIGWNKALDKILSFTDTLEEEVDLEKEIDKWYNNEASKEFENVLYKDIEKCAKHFFELGMSVGNKAQKGE